MIEGVGGQGRGPAPGPEHFGAWLRRWRFAQRMTQAALARALGYDVTYVGKLERGERPPTRQVLARAAAVTRERVPGLELGIEASDVSRPPLPVPAAPLIGRAADVASVSSMIEAGARCLTLTGPPGIGKTRLALEVAGMLDRRVRGGAWFVSLVEVVDPSEVGAHVVRALGLRPSPHTSALDELVSWFRVQEALLVLDNFEHVLPAWPVVAGLLAGAPALSVLVTSREPLGLAAENVWVVAPLGCPEPDGADVATVRASAAGALFASRARMVQPEFTITPHNAEAVAEACLLLDGIPLAIVVAAGASRLLDPAAIVARLRQRAGFPEAVISDLPAHHRSLGDALEWSWRLLDAPERSMLCSLAAFSGGATEEAAVAVALACAGEGDGDGEGEGPGAGPGPQVLSAALASLVRKSLVETRLDAAGGARFEMLEAIRVFAHDRLAGSGMEQPAAARHEAWFLELSSAAATGLLGEPQARWVAVLGDERANLAAAFTHALKANPPAALTMAADLWRFFLMRDAPAGRAMLTRALGAAPDRVPSRALALAGAGALAWVTGNLEESAAYLAQAQELAASIGVRDALALACLNGAALAEQQDALDQSAAMFATAGRLYAELSDGRGQACVLIGQGVLRQREGDVEAAYDLWMAAMHLLHAAGDRFLEALAVSNVAWAALHEGRLDEAERWYRRCRATQVSLGDGRGLAMSADGLARIASRRGDLAEAWRWQAEALAGFRRFGDRRRAAGSLVELADLAERSGDHDLGATLVGSAEALNAEIGAGVRAEDASTLDGVVERLRIALGGGVADRLRSAGQLVALDEAAALVAAVLRPAAPERRGEHPG